MELDRPLVLATKNKGKIAEFRELFEGMSVSLKSLDDFGPIPEVVEDGETFEDNAVKKARFTARVLGFPAIADDSGLVVEALEGRPGVYSSRYAGDHATDLDNNLNFLRTWKTSRTGKPISSASLPLRFHVAPLSFTRGNATASSPTI